MNVVSCRTISADMISILLSFVAWAGKIGLQSSRNANACATYPPPIPRHLRLLAYLQNDFESAHQRWPYDSRFTGTSCYRRYSQHSRITHLIGWEQRRSTLSSRRVHSRTHNFETNQLAHGSKPLRCFANSYLDPQCEPPSHRFLQATSTRGPRDELE